MIPDSNEKFLTIQNGLAAKIALALGIMMKDLSPSCSMLNEGILSKNEIPDVLFLLKDYDSSLKEYAEFCTLKASKVIK